MSKVAMTRLDELTSRPIAHRGLHDSARGIVENTASAFRAAISGGYAIETDVQISADGEAMVHHDATLGRLTEGSARLASLSAAEIKATPFRATADRIMTLGELCDFVAGRSLLVVEVKSQFDGDLRLARRAASVLAHYAGPAVVMSFDPGIVAAFRTIAPDLVRGIVAERRYDDAEWNGLTAYTKRNMAWLLHAPQSRPHFIAYNVNDLPAVAPLAAYWALRVPLLAWTVRTEQQKRTALKWADQIIFEGLAP